MSCIHFVDKMLTSGDADGIIRVWDLDSGHSFALLGHSDNVRQVKILPKKILLSCSDDCLMVKNILTRSCGILKPDRGLEVLQSILAP